MQATLEKFESKTKHDFNLEALRGFAAGIVVVHHLIIYSNKLNGGFDFRKTILPWSPSGHLMVLVFFMLSGFVIGKSYSNRPEFDSRDYLKKRFIRLYPIYFFSILFTIILFKESLSTVLGNLFFLQNLFSNCLINNLSLWSLNHEVLYYFLAILLLKNKISTRNLFLLFLIPLLATFKIANFPCIVQDYLVGFLFWISGFMLSKLSINILEKTQPNKLLSVLFLLLCCDYLNLTNRITSLFTIPNQISFFTLDGMVKISDFNLYFYSLYAVIIFSSVKFRFIKVLTWFVYLNTIFHLLNLFINHSFFKTDIFYTPTLFLFFSIFFNFFNPIKVNLKPLAYLGSISYAVYVIHTPMIFAFCKVSILNT